MDRFQIISALFNAGLDIIAVLQHFDIDVDHSDIGKKIRCPFHDDKTPSLIINADNTVHCFACRVHFDMVETYFALKTGNIDTANYIWDCEDFDDS